jgi:CcmD family protein
MPKNFWWLFAAYSVIWLALFGYVWRLLGRQRELRRDLERLKGGD